MKPSPQGPAAFDHFSSHYEEYVQDPVKDWVGGKGSEYFLRLKVEEICNHLCRLGLDAKKLVTLDVGCGTGLAARMLRSEEHTSELQSHSDLVCRLLLEKKKQDKREAHL